MTFDSLITKLIEDSTSKAPKGDSYDSQNNWKPSGVASYSDGSGGRYRRTRPNTPGRSKATHGGRGVQDEEDADTVEITLPKDLADVLHELLMAVTTADESDDHEELKKNPEEDAEYQGRKVTLNKPTRGDVKKFKVYVKDPKTGNVKKVNFGHGGTSAKKKGEKTMKIRKSNPKARKSFRARHKCDQKKSKLSAGYWSCRKW
tara:strand:+ start:475 stop:1083 length:609 start_codon:yes stop_codon:yes gene_type:complete